MTLTRKPARCWLDIETTHLDKRVGSIVEIACIVADADHHPSPNTHRPSSPKTRRDGASGASPSTPCLACSTSACALARSPSC